MCREEVFFYRFERWDSGGVVYIRGKHLRYDDYGTGSEQDKGVEGTVGVL